MDIYTYEIYSNINQYIHAYLYTFVAFVFAVKINETSKPSLSAIFSCVLMHFLSNWDQPQSQVQTIPCCILECG